MLHFAKVAVHYSALQLILVGSGVKEADGLRDDVGVVFVHSTEETGLARGEGPLKGLDDFRSSTRSEGKPPASTSSSPFVRHLSNS